MSRPLYATGAGSDELPIRYGVDAARAAPAVGDRPDDERLAALHVAGCETPGTFVIHARIARDRATRGRARRPRSVDEPVALRARRTPSRAARGPPRTRSSPCCRPAVAWSRATRPFVGAGEPLGRDRVVALAAFFVRRRDAEDVRPRRPRDSAARACRAGVEQLRAAARCARPDDARCRGSRRRYRRRR